MELHSLQSQLAELRKQKLTIRSLFEQNELFEQFQVKMNEKEKEIDGLRKEIMSVKGHNIMEQVQHAGYAEPLMASMPASNVWSAHKEWRDEKDRWLEGPARTTF